MPPLRSGSLSRRTCCLDPAPARMVGHRLVSIAAMAAPLLALASCGAPGVAWAVGRCGSSTSTAPVQGLRGPKRLMERCSRDVSIAAFADDGAASKEVPQLHHRRSLWLGTGAALGSLLWLLGGRGAVAEAPKGRVERGGEMYSYVESAGLSGQSNKDVQKYGKLGDGLRAVKLETPKFKEGDPDATRFVKAGDTITVDLIGYLTGWNGLVFVRTQDKSGYSEKPVTFKVGAGEAIPGLDRGVVGMVKGEKRRLVIPGKLGYPRPCSDEDLGKPGAIPDPTQSAPGSGAPWELRNRLINGVLNSYRDDTLAIDVKVVRINP